MKTKKPANTIIKSGALCEDEKHLLRFKSQDLPEEKEIKLAARRWKSRGVGKGEVKLRLEKSSGGKAILVFFVLSLFHTFQLHFNC